MPYRILEKSEIDLKTPTFLCDKELHKRVTPPLPNNHHFLLIAGPARSGKTSLAVSMLTSRQAYKKVWHEIHVIMPAASRRSLKDDLFEGHKRCYEELDLPTLLHISHAIEDAAERGRQSLILMDDVGAALKDPEIQRVMKSLIWNRRHHATSIWCLAQSYNSLPMQLRKSVSHLALYKPNRKEAELVFSELVYKSKDDATTMLKFVFQKQHDFLLIDVSNGLFYKNLCLIGNTEDAEPQHWEEIEDDE